jgi:uncharacterized protein YxjI
LRQLGREILEIREEGGVEIDGEFYDVRFRFKSDMALLLHAGELPALLLV